MGGACEVWDFVKGMAADVEVESTAEAWVK